MIALTMSSKHQDYLAQYYGEAPQASSDFEAKPKKKKVVRAPTKQLQGFKMLDDMDAQDEFEELGPLVPEKSTSLKREIRSANFAQLCKCQFPHSLL